MRKLFLVLPVIALTLTGALLATACGGGDSNPVISVVDLNAKIAAANNARFDTKTATAANQVPTGRQWVTEADATTFDNAIKSAEAVRDNPVSQANVNAATSALVNATNTFNAAKQAGTGAAKKLSGTITVKNNGVPVPYVEVVAHSDDWSFDEKKRVTLNAEGTGNWEIIFTPLTEEKEIFFLVAGSIDSSYADELFDMESGVTRTVKDIDISNITIDMSNLKLVKLTGTFSILSPKEIRSVAIQFRKKINESDSVRIGELMLSCHSDGNGRYSTLPFSTSIDSFSGSIHVNINCSSSSYAWDADNSVGRTWLEDFVTVNNANTSVDLNLITLSGTLDATVCSSETDYSYIMMGVELYTGVGSYPYKGLGGPDGYFQKPFVAGTNWSAIIPAFASPTALVSIKVDAYKGNPGDSGNNFTKQHRIKNSNEPKLGSVSNSSISGINIVLPAVEAWDDSH